MQHIVNCLISALGHARQVLTMQEQRSIGMTSMRELTSHELRDVAGGDDDTGPRGGW